MNERTTEVLEQYELEVQSKRRGRGAWICETSQGLKLLREYKGTVKRLEFEEQIMNVLQNQKTCRTDQYMRNREGELLSVAEDGTRCVVKEWFSGRECSVQSEAEVVRAVGQIAKLHRTLRGIAIDESWNLGSILTRPAVAEMERHNRELVRTRNYIRKKRRKSDFERAVSGSFAIFYEQAQEAAGGLKAQIEQDGDQQNQIDSIKQPVKIQNPVIINQGNDDHDRHSKNHSKDLPRHILRSCTSDHKDSDHRNSKHQHDQAEFVIS